MTRIFLRHFIPTAKAGGFRGALLVNQIDVDETARAEKNFCAFGLAFVRVRRRVKRAHVSFGLDDNSARQTVMQVRDKFLADKFAGNSQAVAQIKFALKFHAAEE